MLKLLNRSASIACAVLFTCAICVHANKNEKIQASEKNIVISEVDEMIDDFALFDTKTRSTTIVKNDTHKPPFIWPVDIKLIQQVTMQAPNIAKITLKTKTDVSVMHTGLVIAANPKTKTLIIKHIVEGGVCYITTLKNIDNLCAIVGDIIKVGTVVGTTQALHLEIKQLNVVIAPSIDMLMPPINPSLIKVIRKI